MLISFLRSLILYIVVIFGMRIMGKRQLGQLQPSELVVTILISNIATLPIENSDVPLILGIVPILTLMCFEVILSVCTLKSTRLRKLVWGNTRVLIQNGRINQQELSDLRYSVDDLMEQRRPLSRSAQRAPASRWKIRRRPSWWWTTERSSRRGLSFAR